MVEFPYYRFNTWKWLSGDIQNESLANQAVFINICAYYWSKECQVDLKSIQRRFKKNKKQVNELIELSYIFIDGENIGIIFLNEQWENIEEYREKQSIKGKKSAETRRKNKQEKATTVQQRFNNGSTTVQQEKDKEKDNDKEKDKDKDKENLTKDELLEMFVKKNESYLENLAMGINLTMQDLKLKVVQFTEHLISTDETFKIIDADQKELRRHFGNWIKKNKKSNQSKPTIKF